MDAFNWVEGAYSDLVDLVAKEQFFAAFSNFAIMQVSLLEMDKLRYRVLNSPTGC